MSVEKNYCKFSHCLNTAFFYLHDFVPNYGETCTRQSLRHGVPCEQWYGDIVQLSSGTSQGISLCAIFEKACIKDVKGILKLFFAKTLVDNYVLFLSNFLGGSFVGQSTDSWLTFFSWP